MARSRCTAPSIAHGQWARAERASAGQPDAPEPVRPLEAGIRESVRAHASSAALHRRAPRRARCAAWFEGGHRHAQGGEAATSAQLGARRPTHRDDLRSQCAGIRVSARAHVSAAAPRRAPLADKLRGDVGPCTIKPLHQRLMVQGLDGAGWSCAAGARRTIPASIAASLSARLEAHGGPPSRRSGPATCPCCAASPMANRGPHASAPALDRQKRLAALRRSLCATKAQGCVIRPAGRRWPPSRASRSE